ncbi:hypothetical protein RJ639_000576 [Escallonia herrerae]|uniref:Alginate lyase 2 domain-containing protein n=1 Tax=Escallonia herrerae TaxID=1293975 RepID=A0AA89BP52_9ASTE|nr:hypothetical protein RJ639_000576 [Escallonia herrerae]
MLTQRQVLVFVLANLNLIGGADLTDGFTLVPLTDQNIKLQKPYDKPLYDDGVRSLCSNDKPFKPDSGTRPRTEACICSFPSMHSTDKPSTLTYIGTSGATIMQIFGARDVATTLKLRIYDGDIKYYKFDVVAADMCDKWFRLNVIHNVNEGKKFVVNERGPGDHYFKFGAYAAPANSSNYMESRWKEIKIYKK